jgi:hypothetical protein
VGSYRELYARLTTQPDVEDTVDQPDPVGAGHR